MDNVNAPLSYPNLTHEEIQSIRELTENYKLTIKPSDQGRGIVVMDTDTYIQEAHRQLSDTNVYRKLNRDPKREFEKELIRVRDRAFTEGIIDDKLTPVLFLLPKIHKTLKDPPADQLCQVENLYTAKPPSF